jgi:hypothetical protein
LLAGLALAMVGPAPRRCRSHEAILLGLLAGGFYLLSAAVAIEVSVHLGTLLIAPGVIAFCLSCWLSRGADRRGDGGGGSDDDAPDPDSPFDWDEFDRLRGEWSRSPVGVA